MRERLERLKALEERARAGGGPDKVEKQHKSGKSTARERLAELFDAGSPYFETGLLMAHDRYEGRAPAAGVVTGAGRIEGRPAVAVANDATVKAGAWWPETIAKILRAQEIAMRNRIPIVYLVDSSGVNLPLQDGIFPGQYGAARIFYYNSLMRRKLRVPQIAAVMGPCIAGGAYLPALSDIIIMVEGTSFMGLGGPNLVRGATGEVVDTESLGGAAMHTSVSGVAHYMAKDDAACLEMIRGQFGMMPAPRPVPSGKAPARSADQLYAALPCDHRLPYDVEALLEAIVDAGSLSEFQAGYAPETLCAHAKLEGRPVAIIANRRGFVKSGGVPRVGGVIYAESARKASYFVENAERHGLPIVYLQDASGFMVGTQAESEGIIRAGAEMVETMACATVPKITLTLNHASGAAYYAMAGQGFDPHFAVGWPTARIGVMEGAAAIQAVHGPEIEKHRAAGGGMPEDLRRAIDKTSADYENWLDAFHAASRGHVDALIDPAKTRPTLAFLLEVCCANDVRRPLALDVL